MRGTALSGEQLELFDQRPPSIVETLTFNQAWRLFFDLHWSRRKEASRAEALCRYIVAFFDGRLIHTIGRQDGENLIDHLSKVKRQGPWSLIKARSILRLIFHKLEQWKDDGYAGNCDVSRLLLPKRNPGKAIPAMVTPRRVVFHSPFEVRGWINLARLAGDEGLVSTIRLGLWLRLSPIDLEHLDDSEIDEEAFEVRVYRRHTITPKNPQGCLQRIPLTEKVWGEIARCRKYRRPNETRILYWCNMRRRFAKLRKMARAKGMRDITLGAFRAAAAAALEKDGFDIRTIAQGHGHTTTKMVESLYLPDRNPHLRKATGKLAEIFDD